MKKTKRQNILSLAVILLFASIKVAAASSYQNILEVPLFVHFFLLLNIFLLTVAIVMIQEVKRVSASNVWNDILIGDIFTMIDAFALGVILYKYAVILSIDSSILIFSLYTYAVFMVNIGEYFLIKPLLKEKINLLRIRYILLYVFILPAMYYIFTKVISFTEFPSFQKVIIIFLFILLFIFVIFSFLYNFLSLSKSYAPIGFVSKPFWWSSTGAFSLFIGSVLLFYKLDLNLSYYYVLLYFIPVTLALSYYLRFAIEYPSLLEPKWKALMPFDLPKVATSITLAFLAVSFFFTAKAYQNFSIYQNMPYPLVPLFLLPIFFGIILTFTYLKTLSSKTKLKYWRYLKYGQYIHIAVTFYVLSLALLSWNDLARNTKLFCALFGLVAFAFYLCFALDLLTILKDQTIRPKFNRLDIVRDIVALSSTFSLILFGISFAYDGAFVFARVEFISYPVILFFIAFFLIAFGSYLSVTHKGFEEILGKNIWSELSYIFAFVTFILIYFIYTSLNAHLQRFPYHNLAFIGYFAVLVIEIVSTKTLSEKFKYGKTRKEDIVRLLNFHAYGFLRTDYLEALWGKMLDQNVAEDEVKNVGFDPSRRRFDLERIDEKTRLTVAVRMLLEMNKLPDVEKIRIQRGSLEETKAEIAGILKENILMLPEDLRSEFDESAYYPVLYERAINDLLIPLKTFIPFSEQRTIFERLQRREALFTGINFGVDEIQMKEEAKFSRDVFLKLFRLYIEAIEEQFPFKRFLLYELVRDEIKRELERYNIGVSEVLNIVPTGIEGMDKIMAGGLMKGSTTLLITEETKTKQKIIISFIEQGLVEGSFAIYATSKRPFHQMVGEILMDTEDLRNLLILDFYEDLYTEGRISELVEDENRIIVPLNKILYQRSIVKAIKSQPKEAPKIVIIDVYDEFSRYYSPGEIFMILQKQIEGLKRWNCTSVIVLDPQSHLIKKEGVDNVKKHFENVMILSGEDKASSAFIEKLYHGTPSKHIIHLPW